MPTSASSLVLKRTLGLLDEICEAHGLSQPVDPSAISVYQDAGVWFYSIDKKTVGPVSLPLAMRIAYPYRERRILPKGTYNKRPLLPPVLRHIGKVAFGFDDLEIKNWMSPASAAGGEGKVWLIAACVATYLCKSQSYLNAAGDLREDWQYVRGDGFREKETKEYCEQNHQIDRERVIDPISNLDGWICKALIGTPDFKKLIKPPINSLKNGLALLFAEHNGSQVLRRLMPLCKCAICSEEGKTAVSADNRCEREQVANVVTLHGLLTSEQAWEWNSHECPVCQKRWLIPAEHVHKMKAQVVQAVVQRFPTRSNADLQDWLRRKGLVKLYKSVRPMLRTIRMKELKQIQDSAPMSREVQFACPSCDFSVDIHGYLEAGLDEVFPFWTQRDTVFLRGRIDVLPRESRASGASPDVAESNPSLPTSTDSNTQVNADHKALYLRICNDACTPEDEATWREISVLQREAIVSACIADLNHNRDTKESEDE